MKNYIQREWLDLVILLRNIPSLVVRTDLNKPLMDDSTLWNRLIDVTPLTFRPLRHIIVLVKQNKVEQDVIFLS